MRHVIISEFHSASLSALIAIAALLFGSYSMDAVEKTLKSNSPFLPPGYNEPKTPANNKTAPAPSGAIAREVEFHGLSKFRGVYRFSILDKKEKRAYWIELNQSEGGIGVRNYNEKEKSILITKSGRSETLTLLKSDNKPMPIVNNAHQNRTNPNIPIRNRNTAVVNNRSDRRRSTTVPRRRVVVPTNK